MRIQRTPLPSQHPSALTEAQLVASVRAGDAAALGELYERFGSRLLALAHRLLASREDAEDVLHDVFLGVPEALRSYTDEGTLGAWLKRVTARVALNRMRTQRRRHESALADASAMIARSSQPIDAIALGDAMAQLPDSLRVVFVLKEVEGFSHAEIADFLDISRGASEVRFHRAIRALRTLLEPTR